MLNIVLVLIGIVCVTYWVYKVATYDWSQFEADQEQAKKDLF